MADLCSAVQAINDLIVKIERMENSSEIGSIVLRLDFINRMLVSLDVPPGGGGDSHKFLIGVCREGS